MNPKKYIIGCISYFGSIAMLIIFIGYVFGWQEAGNMLYIVKKENNLLRYERILQYKQFKIIEKEIERNEKQLQNLKNFLCVVGAWDRYYFMLTNPRNSNRTARLEYNQDW